MERGLGGGASPVRSRFIDPRRSPDDRVMNLDRYFRPPAARREDLDRDDGAADAGRPSDRERATRTVPIYLEPNWAGHPSVRFLDPVQREYLPFDPGTSLPVTTDSAAIFIGDRPGAAQRIAAFYPGADRTVTVLPRHRPRVRLRVPPLARGRPVDARQSRRAIEGQSGVVERREPGLAFDFPARAPMPAPFAATWTASLSVPAYVTYRLRLEGPASLTLTIDGAATCSRAATRPRSGRHEGCMRCGSPAPTWALSRSRSCWAATNEDLQPVPCEPVERPPGRDGGIARAGLPWRPAAGRRAGSSSRSTRTSSCGSTCYRCRDRTPSNGAAPFGSTVTVATGSG